MMLHLKLFGGDNKQATYYMIRRSFENKNF